MDRENSQMLLSRCCQPCESCGWRLGCLMRCLCKCLKLLVLKFQLLRTRMKLLLAASPTITGLMKSGQHVVASSARGFDLVLPLGTSSGQNLAHADGDVILPPPPF